MQQGIGNRHFAALRSLDAALSDLNIDGALIGGVAVSLQAEPRFTRDLDAMIMLDTEDVDTLIAACVRHGLVPLMNDPHGFAVESRVLPLRHEATGLIVDVALGCMPLEAETIKRAQKSPDSSIPLKLATP